MIQRRIGRYRHITLSAIKQGFQFEMLYYIIKMKTDLNVKSKGNPKLYIVKRIMNNCCKLQVFTDNNSLK